MKTYNDILSAVKKGWVISVTSYYDNVNIYKIGRNGYPVSSFNGSAESIFNGGGNVDILFTIGIVKTGNKFFIPCIKNSKILIKECGMFNKLFKDLNNRFVYDEVIYNGFDDLPIEFKRMEDAIVFCNSKNSL